MAFTLKAIKREIIGRKTNELRDEGFIPAIIYGARKNPINISVNRQAFLRIYQQAGESTLIDLEMETGEIEAVLIQDFQRSSVQDQMIHADFRRVDLDKPLVVDVQLYLVGEAPAVRELGGTLISSRHTVQVRALPRDLIKTLEIDLSTLKTFNDVIRVSDISCPEGVQILDENDLSLVTVMPPRTDEELKQLDEAIQEDVSQVERVGKKEEVPEEEDAAKTPEAS